MKYLGMCTMFFISTLNIFGGKGFFGCGHFKKINEILKNIGKVEIDWQIKNL